MKVFFKIREIFFESHDGLTLGIGRLHPITEGWVVKMKDCTDFEGEEGMIAAVQIASKTTKTIQGYKDGKLELWDVVKIFDNEEAATKAGKKNGQMTIYQIETGKLKWID